MKKGNKKALEKENLDLKIRISELQHQFKKITTEKEKALIAEHSRLETVIGNLDAGIFLLSLDGHIIFADNQIASILGCTHSEIIGMEYLSFVFPEEQEKAKKDLSDGLLIDITDRKNAEKAIREKEKRLSGIFRAVPVGLGIVFQRHFTEVNEQICQMSGYSREELLGHSTEMLYLSRDDFDKTGSILYSMLEKNGTASIETQWRHKSGRPVDVLLNLAPLDPGKSDSGIAVSILDLTQRKRSESERERLENLLRQAQKMEVIGRFAGGIAHDFGNLLSPIAGYASLLAIDIPESDPKHLLIRQIINTAMKAKMLIQQLLMFSRQQPVEKSAIDLEQMINNLLTMLQPAVPENIRISCQFALPLSPIIGDTMQVEQVFLNLIVNAKDAMPAGGTITIGLEEALISEPLSQFTPIPLQPGQYILLTVKDSGTGIPMEILPKIFEPFFSTKKAGKGTGLGLSIVYEIVEKHGGSIQVQSEIGKGTTFKVYFPIFADANKTEI